jgi:hypothetical protein|tara:strand:- start:309 stop:503 length:195 start_codon:yes stop_codon:yes gene_type:complete
MLSISTDEAEDIIQAINHGVHLTRQHSTSYAIVYIDKLQTAVPMKAEPCPSEFGWQVMARIEPD